MLTAVFVPAAPQSNDGTVATRELTIREIQIPSQREYVEAAVQMMMTGISSESFINLKEGGIAIPVREGGGITLEVVSEAFEPLSSAVRAFFDSASIVPGDLTIQGVRFSDVVTLGEKRFARVAFDILRRDSRNAIIVRGKTVVRLKEPIAQVKDRVFVPSEQRTAENQAVSWFSSFSALTKMRVDKDGTAKMSYDDLVSENPLFVGADPTNIHLVRDGKENPFSVILNGSGLFGSGASVYFPAQKSYVDERLREENPYQLDGIYWLGLSNDARPALVDSVPVTIPSFDSLGRARVRWENRTIFHFGNGSFFDRNLTGPVPGKGWYSGRLRSGDIAALGFDLPGFLSIPTDSAEIQVRLMSSTARQDPLFDPDHRIRISMNGTFLQDVLMNGYEEKTAVLRIQSSIAQQSGNILRLESIDSGKPVNEVLYDYALVEYTRQLRSENGAIQFEITKEGRTAAAFRITDFPSQNITLFRYSDLDSSWRQIVGFTVSPAGNGYAAVVQDTIEGRQLYFAACNDSAMSVLSQKARSIDDLSSPGNGADYVVLTDPELLPAANRLAQYRQQTHGVRTRVIQIEDVYDVFDCGLPSPLAIRRFFTHAFLQWTGNPLKSAVLLGQANWDGRDYLKTGRPNTVPSFGNPVSDTWYGIVESLDSLVPQISIGRISARTLAEANRYMTNLEEYEAYAPSIWNKYIMTMSGGLTDQERSSFASYMESLVNTYVLPNPFAGIARRIYKKTNTIDFEETNELREFLEQGALWISFFGHAAATTWDNGVTNPQQLANKQNKMPLMTDFSCSTVRFAEPTLRCFGEQFVFSDSHPAIAYVGSSGFGFVGPLQTIGRSMFRSFLSDTLATLGEAMQALRMDVWGAYGNSATTMSTINQYSLLGDPLLRISIPRQPDLAIGASGIRVAQLTVTDRDSAAEVIAELTNYGLVAPDSVEVEFRDVTSGTTVQTLIHKIPPIRNIDSVRFSWIPTNRSGIHTLNVEIDPGRKISEFTTSNNQGFLQFFVISSSIRNVAPLDGTTINVDPINFIVDVPGFNGLTALLDIEVDTSGQFLSPTLIRTVLAQGGPQRVQVPGLSDLRQYFWRSSLVQGPATESSPRQRFYTDVQSQTPPTWKQGPESFSTSLNPSVNVEFRSTGVLLSQGGRSISILSAGYEDGNNSEILIDGFSVLTGVAFRGFNVVALDDQTGEVQGVRNFDTYGDTTASRSFREFANSLLDGQFLVISVQDEASNLLDDSLKAAIRMFGAAEIDNLSFRDSYALLGRKGIAPGTARELRMPRSTGMAQIVDSIEYRARTGNIATPLIGPSLQWQSILVTLQNHSNTATLPILIECLDRNGVMTTFRGPLSDIPLMIDSINQRKVLWARLQLTMMLDSSNLVARPVLTGWALNYVPPPELSYVGGKLFLSADTVVEGENVEITGFVTNVGYSRADSVDIQLSERVGQSPLSVVESLRVPKIDIGETIEARFNLKTRGRIGEVVYLMAIDTPQVGPDLFAINNTLQSTLLIERDRSRPALAFTFDGSGIIDGDFVAPEPEIVILIQDPDLLPLADTASVNVIFDGRRLSYADGSLQFISNSSQAKAEVKLKPRLGEGLHQLEAYAVDASGNTSDSSQGRISFRTIASTAFREIYTFPNPFHRDTHFTFHLTGETIPDELHIKIFSVAGRLVSEIVVYGNQLRIGFNNVYWSGRDNEGNELANGIYFYKLVARGRANIESGIERIAILR